MATHPSHLLALDLFRAGNPQAAAAILAQLLLDEESSEIWNDWATAHFHGARREEALEGFRRAVELDANNVTARLNLGMALLAQQSWSEAIGELELCLSQLVESEAKTVRFLLEDCRKNHLARNSSAFWRDYLLRFAGVDPNSRSYLATHLDRYIATLELLPDANPGDILLELGAAFHHLTPAVENAKGYRVRCSDIWEGNRQAEHVVMADGGRESFRFAVDNFDVETVPWPYPDASFNAVLCCEMLEHLITDPMALLSEINRVLVPSGYLVLTTPNIASAKSIEYALRGESPYIYGKFELRGRPTDRHNREYTCSELERFLGFAGLKVERIFTREIWWRTDRQLYRLLAGHGYPLAGRGDNIFCLARKAGTVKERYPEELYLRHGVQSVRRDTEVRPASAVEERCRRRILVVHEVVPQPDRHGCDVRLLQVLQELVRQGHEVTLIGRNGHLSEQYRKPLEDMGVKVWADDSERLAPLGIQVPLTWRLEQVLADGDFDLAILLLWFWYGFTIPEHYMEDIRRISPRTRIAVLTDDHHGLREQRLAERSGNWVDFERAQEYSYRESRIYRHADLVLSISEDDRRGLLENSPGLSIQLLPMVAETSSGGPGFHERQDFLFVGNFHYNQNRDGVQWVLDRVWPKIRTLVPEAKLALAGSNFPHGIAAGHDGVIELGHVPDLTSLYARYRLFLSPALYGTGIKTKNLGAMGHGVPIVTTTIGAEGMHLANGVNALIADDPEEFASAAAEAYRDPELWNELAHQGLLHLEREFGPDRLSKAIRALIEDAALIEPKPHDPSHIWSFQLVDQRFPGIVSSRPVRYRLSLRILRQLQIAEKLRERGEPGEALQQLRHILDVIKEKFADCAFAPYLLRLMADCYNDCGNRDRFDVCRRAEEKLKARTNSVLPRRLHSAGRRRVRPEVSVIIPTYNHSAQLAACLAHLAGQSLHPDRWELIIVDDGSSDGTEQLCLSIPTFCNFRYVRRLHSGRGSTRHHGAKLSRGEYILFLADDVVPHRQLLEKHLQAHYGTRSKVAVLGACGLPLEAEWDPLTRLCGASPAFFVPLLLTGLPPTTNWSGAHNFSMHRDTFLAMGSFDPTLSVGDDIDLGVRLSRHKVPIAQLGEVHADHFVLRLTFQDLERKVLRDAQAQYSLLRRYPQLLKQGNHPYGRLDERSFGQMRAQIEDQAADAAHWREVLRALQAVDLSKMADQHGVVSERQKTLLKSAETLRKLYPWLLLKAFVEIAQPATVEPTSSEQEAKVAVPSC